MIRIRPEIQALRALAILLATTYHLWPSVLPKGFVGVDVFFVLSGFLITALLLREVETTGRIALSHFWARRMRRLLPAAFLVLTAATIATAVFLPKTAWTANFSEIRASAVYLQNWLLAINHVDYTAADEVRSTVQHYWSLSVEEQFYTAWPVLLAAAVAVSKPTAANRLRAIRATLTALTAASFIHWVRAAAADPAVTYFDTTARAWEFGVGGLLATWREKTEGDSALRSVASWSGLFAIVFAARASTNGTSFAGAAPLLSTAGTLAVISAGASERAWSPGPLMRLRPVQLVGDISYSIYLWQWPMIVVLTEILGGSLGFGSRLAVAAASVAAALLTYVFVENPWRRGRGLRRGPGYTFALAAIAMTVLFASLTIVLKRLRAETLLEVNAAERIMSENPPCLGAAARDPQSQPCRNPRLDGVLIPGALGHQAQGEVIAKSFPGRAPDSDARNGIEGLSVAEFGAPASRAAATFVLVGDSTAARLLFAFEPIARARSWRGFKITMPGCPASLASDPRCSEWNRRMLAWIRKHPEVRTLITTSITRATGPGQIRGYRQEWKSLPPSIKNIVVLRTHPVNLQPDCVDRMLARRADPARACSDPRAAALTEDVAATAARLDAPRADVVDLTPFYCDAARCYHVVGGVRVYDDARHLTVEFVRTLAPYVMRGLDAISVRRKITAD